VKIIFTQSAWEEYLFWQSTNPKTSKRINSLIKETARNPYSGIGKPEGLKHMLSGYWSRRVDQQNRMVYKVEENSLLIIQLRYHY
jgi:toxin YoeB